MLPIKVSLLVITKVLLLSASRGDLVIFHCLRLRLE